MIAALAAAAGVYYTGLSLEATREQNAVAEQGQITDRLAQEADRFTKAVDQLDRAGADHLQARLGAVYALERLARDAPQNHPVIVKVLTAFIRTTTPQPTPATTTGTYATCHQDAPADIQAALTVLGNRNPTHDDPTDQINLQNTCLRHANLTSADFTAEDLIDNPDVGGSNISMIAEGAYLSGAKLTGADLTDANLGIADLTDANLTDANLGNASLAGADLTGADLRGANLRSADLRYAHLTGADLTGADLTDANLPYADLTGANLAGANLTGAVLTGAVHDEYTVVSRVTINELTQGVWW